MQKHPEGDLDRACGACAHVHDRERERKREAGGGGGGGICENDIRLFRQNELYYCIQP